MVSKLRANEDSFYWINHTGDYENLDAADEDMAEEEIRRTALWRRTGSHPLQLRRGGHPRDHRAQQRDASAGLLQPASARSAASDASEV